MPKRHTLSLLVLSGTIAVDGREVARAGQTIVLGRSGVPVSIESNSKAKLVMLAGEPIDEPVVAHGPVVTSTVEEILRAMLIFQTGRCGRFAERDAA